MHTDRRRYLQALGAGAISLVAGCTGNSNSGSSEGGNGSNESNGSDSGAGTVGHSNSANLDKVSAEIGSPFNKGDITIKTAEMFKNIMEDETDGNFSVKISSGGSYGGEGEINSLVSNNSIEGFVGGPSPFSSNVPKYAYFMNPFMFKEWDQYTSVLKSDTWKEGAKKLREKADMRLIGDGNLFYRGKRHHTANKPIRKPDDLKGVDIRLPTIETWTPLWKTLGANPSQVSLDDLYSSLNQGIVDASEGPAPQISSYNLNETQSHLSLTGHGFAVGGIFFNETFFQNLDETYQDLVLKAGRKSHKKASKMSMEKEKELINKLGNNGMTVIRNVDRDAFFESTKPKTKELFKKYWSVTSYKKIHNL